MASYPSRLSRRHVLLALSFIGARLVGAATDPASKAQPSAIDERVQALLGQMTVEEKVGQLVQYSSRKDMTGPVSAAARTPAIGSGAVGSLLNVTGAAETRKWQKVAVESSRLHLPLLFGLDVIHGYRTILPIPLATAASWDLAAIERGERIAATEATSAGIHWTFAPMVDIARDPRWGRISEGAGEDPYLGTAVARARIHGFQGDDLAATDTLLACAKHFAGYGAAQAGRDYYTTDISERALREIYLPPFHAAVQAGVGTIMAAFNDLDGTPSSANSLLLDRVLRREWGFRGFVVSDWASIAELQSHGLVVDLRSAAAQAFRAGVDMDMENEAYGPYLAELVHKGIVPTARLDAAAGAILRAKAQLGLLDDPYRYSDEQRERDTLARPEFRAAARDLVRRTCVLLKNDRATLPLKSAGLSIAVIGPLADSPRHQLGAWEARGDPTDSVTLRTALEEAYPGHVHYALGCEVRGDDTGGFAAARAAADAADVVVLALGEDAKQSGEAASRTSLELSGPQAKLVKFLHDAGKPMVLLLMTGRPLTLEGIEPLVDAIVVGWHPGTMGGPGLVDVLTGAYNPSARLPLSWPRSVGQIPIFYAHKNSGRPRATRMDDRYYSRYIDAPNTPQYPFGFGLSYTTFAYDNLRLSTTKLTGTSSLAVTIRVQNTGTRPGTETVQLYLHDRVGSVTRPVRELKGFRQVSLDPGESRDVTFSLTSADLAFWRADMTYGFEPGDFDVFVGPNSDAELSAAFTLE